MSWPQRQRHRLLRHCCRERFYTFVRFAFGVKRNPRGRWLTDDFHEPLCNLLEREARAWLKRRAAGLQGRAKVMVCVPRGMGKTVTVTKAFPMWLHLQDVDLSVVIDSEATAKAEDFLGSIKTVYEGGDPHALFRWLYGQWHSPDRMWRDSKFTHSQRRQMSLTEPSFSTTSVEKGATGFHPDALVVDDLISQERIRDQGNWITLAVNHVHALIPALRTDSFQLVVGTPYTNNDVINTLLEEDGIREAHGMKLPPSFPPVDPDKGQWVLYFMQARDRSGHSVLPEAWSDAELDDYETKRPVDFAAQMMCTPGVGEHMPLVQSQVDELWVRKDDVPSNLGYVITCDTAFKSRKRLASGDESVIQVWGFDQKRAGDVYYEEGYGSNSWRIEEFSAKLVAICQRLRAQGRRIIAIIDERIPGGKEGTWEAYLRNVFSDAGMFLPRLIMLTRQHTNKVERHTEAAGYWVDGRVRLVRNAPGAHKLVRQMLQIGVSAHDDWADCASDVFNQEVYRPMVAMDQGENPLPKRPFDRYLLTGQMDDEAARDAYDMSEEMEEWEKASGVW